MVEFLMLDADLLPSILVVLAHIVRFTYRALQKYLHSHTGNRHARAPAVGRPQRRIPQVRTTCATSTPAKERLFEKFERGRKESATPGVGLGLAICRAIVLAHGGSIRGETRPEGRARFVFTLPRGEPPRIEEPPDDPDNAGMDVTS
jgi:light-regulated signal transduction histidine kinase (bacteriophytochrome)